MEDSRTLFWSSNFPCACDVCRQFGHVPSKRIARPAPRVHSAEIKCVQTYTRWFWVKKQNLCPMIRSSLCGYFRIHRILCTDRSLQLWLMFLDDSTKSSLVAVSLVLCRPYFHSILRARKSHGKRLGKSTITG
jgi:hypothetical protein